MRVLIVDDHESARLSLRGYIEESGIPPGCVLEASSLEQALDRLAAGTIDVAFVDIRLSADPRNRDGLILIERMKKSQPATTPIVVTGLNEAAEIREALRLKVHQYVLRDMIGEIVGPLLRDLKAQQDLKREVRAYRSQASERRVGDILIGNSPVMCKLREDIERATTAPDDCYVLILGPTGSGKELVAQALHALGPHPGEPFLAVNCSNLSEELGRSELFGHRRNSFNGAEDHYGFASTVGNGTLFLDEVADLKSALQPELLRFLESRTFHRIGESDKPLTFNGRLVAATHFAEKIQRDSFRSDLYHRLNIITLHVPPLEERREDIPELAKRFASREFRPIEFTADALEDLKYFSWPGHVRELRNLVKRLCVFSKGTRVTSADLREFKGARATIQDMLQRLSSDLLELNVPNKLRAIEDALLGEALRRTKGNIAEASRCLGVERGVVRRWCDRTRTAPANPIEIPASDELPSAPGP